MTRFLALVGVALALTLILGCASSDYPQAKSNVRSSSIVQGNDTAKPALALGGECPVCLVEMGKRVAGKEEFSSAYDGYKYLFPSEKQKVMFDADPGRYAVQDHGNCVVCKVEMNKEIKGDPKLFALHNKKIYLFVGEKQKKMFDSNPVKYAGEAKSPKAAGSGATRE